MYKAYVRELFRKAAGASWRAANGLMGGALAGVALVWPGVLSIFSNAKWWTQAANWLLSFVLYALVAWLALFLLHLMFIAPYLCWKSLAEKARTPDDGARRREVVDHDKKIAARIRDLFPEDHEQKLMSDLWHEHVYWDAQGNMLEYVVRFISSAEAHFVTEKLRESAAKFAAAGVELLDFMGMKFFVHPKGQRDRPIRFAMQPSLNVDRDGNGSPEQDKKYRELTSKLEALVSATTASYDALIREFHAELLE